MIFFNWVYKPWKSSHIIVRQIWETAGKYTTEWLVSKALFYMSIERKACFISYTHSRTAESLYLLCLIARNLSHIGSGYILVINSFRKGFWKEDVKKEPDREWVIFENLWVWRQQGRQGKTREGAPLTHSSVDPEICDCPQVTWIAGRPLLGASLLAGRANLCYSAFSCRGPAIPCSMTLGFSKLSPPGQLQSWPGNRGNPLANATRECWDGRNMS